MGQSASYSSTAGALATPTTMQTYVGITQQDLGCDPLASPPSRDVAGSVGAYNAFSTTMTAPLGPQLTNGNPISPYLAGGQAMPRAAAQTMSHGYGEPIEYRAPQQPHPPQAHASGADAVYPMMDQAARASFGFAAYHLNAQASGPPQAGTQYYPVDPQQQNASHYQMTHASSEP
jgi:hypothetical protein